jgi:hypothetical protein
MSLFNLFSKKSKSPIETKVFSIRDRILDQLSKVDNYRDLSDNSKYLENQYKRFIATILSGSLISLKYKRTQKLSDDDPLLKQLFRIIFIEAISFQEDYIIPDIIEYDILAHNSLKERNYLLLYIMDKYNRYSEDVDHGLKTNEPYYFEEFDDPDSEFSGYKNHFLFLRELFFIESVERTNGIEIKSNDYDVDWERFDEFFSFILKTYSDI